MKTAELPEERSCKNCAFEDGCKMSNFVDTCSEHRFEWEFDEIDQEGDEDGHFKLAE